MSQKQKKHISVRRVLNVALAAVLSVTCLATVALAASPDFRTAVLSFFRVEEREQVPSGSGAVGEPDISQADIGDLVRAQYIRLPDNYSYTASSGGLFSAMTWTEDYRTLTDAKFWEAQNNELVPVDVDLHTEQVDFTFKNQQYQGELYWYIRDGELIAFKGAPVGLDARPEDEWYINTIPGRTDEILIRLYQGSQMDYSEYPILYHLDTGEVEDILAGIDVTGPGRAYAFDWSEDMRRVLIMYDPAPEGQQTWLADLETGTLTLLKDLTGVEAEFANFINNNTLTLTAYTIDQEDTREKVSCWVYDISSGRAVKVLDQLPYYRWWDETPYGVITFNQSCVYVSETGQVELFDLKTGERIPVEGFTYQKGDEFMPNPSANKLLYYSVDPDAKGLGITQLGVVDLEKHTFIAFDREGYENLYEGGIGWQDDSTVSINASTLDGETRYLLLYQF